MVEVSEENKFQHRLRLSQQDQSIKKRIDSMRRILEETGPLIAVDLMKKLDFTPKETTFYRDVRRMLVAGAAKLENGRLAAANFSDLGEMIYRALKLNTYCDIDTLQLYDYWTDEEDPEMILERVASRIGQDPKAEKYRETFFKTYRKLLLRVQEKRDAGDFKNEWGSHLLFFDNPATGKNAQLK